MIKKLIISAVVLTALISGKEANAAGPGGFARGLSAAVTAQIHVSEIPSIERRDSAVEITTPALTFTQRRELLRVNSAVNSAIGDLDGYFDSVAGVAPSAEVAKGCFDCADLKRDNLLELGWSADVMRIAYSVSEEGRIERVLVVKTDRGDVILGNDSPMIDMSGIQSPSLIGGHETIAKPAYLDI